MDSMLRRFASLLLVVIAVAFSSSSAAARRTSPCDAGETHGAYTPYLCPGDNLVAGAYIASPNSHFRLYVGACNAPVYDVTDQDNPQFLYEIYFDPSECLARIIYSDSRLEGIAASPINYSLRESNDELIGFRDVEFQPEGGHLMMIDDVGCVQIRDQDGTRKVVTPYGGYPPCG